MKKDFFTQPGKTLGGRVAQAGVFALAVAVLVVVLGYSGIYRCPIRRILGVDCPGCGMTRAALALLQFDFKGAMALNPLIYVVAVYGALLFWEWCRGAGRLLKSTWFWGVLCILFLAGWLWRLFQFFNGHNGNFVEPGGLLWRIVVLFA